MGMQGDAVGIIGGGIAGLTSALAFAKAGASVRVSERAPALTDVGAGIQITPNAARPLQALGVWDTLRARGIAAEAVVPTDGLTGAPVTRFDLRGFTPGYLFLHRADLIDVLASAADGAGVGISLSDEGDTAQTSGDLVVGAEGLRSPSRARLNGASDPFFTGQVAWRAIVEARDHAPEAQIWMMPGRHVVTYPLAGGRLNIVAVQERTAWAEEGWNHADDPANLRAAFDDAAPGLQDILGRVEEVNLWGLFRHPVAPTWQDGHTALVGDAAHPTLPFLAQGANLAIEDAFVLARCCTEDGVAEGLRRYEDMRRGRVARAIGAANANAVNYHLRGPRRAVSFAVLRAIGRVAPGAFLSRMSWLYDHDVTA